MNSRRRDRCALTSLATLAGVALAVIGTGASAADAQVRASFGIQIDDRGHRSGYSNHDRGYSAPVVIESHSGFAGTLRVNNRACRIDLGDVCGSISRHFRLSGYHSWHENGKVFVRVGHRKPGVSWSSCDYGARISYQGDCLVIDPYLIERVRPVYERPVHRYSPPRYAPRYEHRRYQPAPRYRPAPGCGW